MFFALTLAGALLWARQRQPLAIEWFEVDVPGDAPLRAVAVRPRTSERTPLVFYAHARNDTLERDGNDLRRIAAAGLAVVSFSYDPADAERFDRQFKALGAHLSRRPWADPDRLAWVGDSLGANRLVEFAYRHPDAWPRAAVLLSAGRVKELAGAGAMPLPRPGPSWIVVHGETDEEVPAVDARALAQALEARWQVVPEVPHNLEPARRALLRWVGETCRTAVDPAWTGEGLAAADPRPGARTGLSWYLAPAALWVAVVLLSGLRWPRARQPQPAQPWPARAAAWIALVLAGVVVAEGALRTWTRHAKAGPFSLAVARHWLVPRGGDADFDYLVKLDRASLRPLGAILDEIEIAGYARQLTLWQIPKKLYRESVLAPTIQDEPPPAMGWRRSLWAEFYPYVRRAVMPADAARIAVRHLRSRVTVWDGARAGPDPRADWVRQTTNSAGFERLYIAVLRAVNVPARVGRVGRAELWDGTDWAPAPRPPVAGVAAH